MSKCELGDAVQWQNGTAWNVGRTVLLGGKNITKNNGVPHFVSVVDHVLVAHSHTRELEFVQLAILHPYPSSPIPQPEGK